MSEECDPRAKSDRERLHLVHGKGQVEVVETRPIGGFGKVAAERASLLQFIPGETCVVARSGVKS